MNRIPNRKFDSNSNRISKVRRSLLQTCDRHPLYHMRIGRLADRPGHCITGVSGEEIRTAVIFLIVGSVSKKRCSANCVKFHKSIALVSTEEKRAQISLLVTQQKSR